MGKSQSRIAHEAALSRFSPLEQAHLLLLFDLLAGPDSSLIHPHSFLTHCTLIPERERIPLFKALNHKKPLDRSAFCIAMAKATRGSPAEKAAILYRWCARGRHKVKMTAVRAFMTALGSAALGIHPLKTKEKNNYVVSEAFVTMLLLSLNEETLPQMEDNLMEEMKTPTCFSALRAPWKRFTRRGGRIALEDTDDDDDDDEDDVRDENEPPEGDKNQALVPDGGKERSKLLDSGPMERKKSDGRERKRSKPRKYNSFDKRTAGVDGDTEEAWEEEGSLVAHATRKISRSTIAPVPEERETSSLHRLKTGNKSKRKVTKAEFRAWVEREQRILLLFDCVMNRLFMRQKDIFAGQVAEPGVVEEFRRLKRERGLNPPILSYHTRLLKTEDVWFLSLHVPKESRHQWRLLYSDLVHGRSWAKLVSNIVGQGPTIVVVEDEQKNVFGGFASASWDKAPSFYGDSSSFLFSLSPSLDIFFPSHFNDNFQYLNSGAKTLPNGLGMGGQLNYFGLWLDSSFEFGHSKASPLSTTFSSPQLSHEETFKIKFVEIWGLVEPKIDPNREVPGKSVLDAHREDRKVLELAGHEGYSRHMKETAFDDDD